MIWTLQSLVVFSHLWSSANLPFMRQNGFKIFRLGKYFCRPCRDNPLCTHDLKLRTSRILEYFDHLQVKLSVAFLDVWKRLERYTWGVLSYMADYILCQHLSLSFLASRSWPSCPCPSRHVSLPQDHISWLEKRDFRDHASMGSFLTTGKSSML